MHRISTDAEWLKTGRVVIDADGVEVDLSAALDANRRASITWSYGGTVTPTLSDFPGIKIGDYIVRKSDGQEWRVDEGKLTPITNPVALRLDTTVGTRIFAGDTMIHGDTGWRDVKDLLESGITAKTARIKRTNDEVSWVFDLNILEGTSVVKLLSSFPVEFLPEQFTYLPPGYLSTNGTTGASASVMLPSNDRTWMAAPLGGSQQGNFCTGTSTPWVGPDTLKWSGSMKTTRAFPTTLPGTPA